MGVLDHLLPIARQVGHAGRFRSELLVAYNPQSVRAAGRIEDIHAELKNASVIAHSGTRDRIENDLPFFEARCGKFCRIVAGYGKNPTSTLVCRYPLGKIHILERAWSLLHGLLMLC